MHSRFNVGAAIGWTTLVLGLVFVPVAARLAAQFPPAQSIEVRELVLVNAGGDPRATLSLVRDRPVLKLFDTDGTVQLTLGLSGDGPALLVKDKSGKVQNFLSTDAGLVPTPASAR